MGLRKWEVKDANRNTITVTAPSKTKAKQAYKRMMGTTARIATVKDIGPAPDNIRLPYTKNGKPVEKFEPVEQIKVTAEPGPNKPCDCGSGKKFKRCHGALGRTRPTVRRPDAKAAVPRVQLPPVSDERGGHKEGAQDAGAPQAAPADEEGAPSGA
jgi:hypothetical protein